MSKNNYLITSNKTLILTLSINYINNYTQTVQKIVLSFLLEIDKI